MDKHAKMLIASECLHRGIIPTSSYINCGNHLEIVIIGTYISRGYVLLESSALVVTRETLDQIIVQRKAIVLSQIISEFRNVYRQKFLVKNFRSFFTDSGRQTSQ